jgi:type IV secretory pathway VirB10-like protein
MTLRSQAAVRAKPTPAGRWSASRNRWRQGTRTHSDVPIRLLALKHDGLDRFSHHRIKIRRNHRSATLPQPSQVPKPSRQTRHRHDAPSSPGHENEKRPGPRDGNRRVEASPRHPGAHQRPAITKTTPHRKRGDRQQCQEPDGKPCSRILFSQNAQQRPRKECDQQSFGQRVQNALDRYLRHVCRDKDKASSLGTRS